MRIVIPAPITAITFLRGMVALIFMAHALVRLANGSVPQFAGFLESRGFPYGTALVLMISTYEIVGGALLAIGIWVKWVCAGLALIVLIGIVLIHAHFGWFVGEHGTSGMEFSWLLVTALFVLTSFDEANRLHPKTVH